MLFLALTLLACGDTDDTKDTEDTDDTDVTELVCEEPVAPPCVDDLILDLSLHDDKTSDSEVSTTTDDGAFLTYVDASAGGMSGSADHPWVYVRFDEDGAHRVDIDDETALEDMTWHAAARRYVIRLNSGDSGPSCVGARLYKDSTYAELGAPDEGVEWLLEDFYSDECELVVDDIGGAATVMVDWWGYGESGLYTNEYPYHLRLEDGRVIKMVVESYDGGEMEWRWEQVSP